MLEIGIGSGLNFSRFADQVDSLDPSPRLLAMARHPTEAARASAWLVQGTAIAPEGDVAHRLTPLGAASQAAVTSIARLTPVFAR